MKRKGLFLAFGLLCASLIIPVSSKAGNEEKGQLSLVSALLAQNQGLKRTPVRRKGRSTSREKKVPVVQNELLKSPDPLQEPNAAPPLLEVFAETPARLDPRKR